MAKTDPPLRVLGSCCCWADVGADVKRSNKKTLSIQRAKSCKLCFCKRRFIFELFYTCLRRWTKIPRLSKPKKITKGERRSNGFAMSTLTINSCVCSVVVCVAIIFKKTRSRSYFLAWLLVRSLPKVEWVKELSSRVSSVLLQQDAKYSAQEGPTTKRNLPAPRPRPQHRYLIGGLNVFAHFVTMLASTARS